MRLSVLSLFAFSVTLFTAATAARAQSRLYDRIVGQPAAKATVSVRGNVHPFATPRYERGRIDPSFRMERITMMFKPTDAQQSDLDKLVEDQQNPASPNYHKWLTPE